MAGIMDEYDPATPVSKTYCMRLSSDEYENQASSCTENALAELIEYLEKNPGSYRRVMTQRKKEEEENAGFFSYAKIKLLSLLSGKDSVAVSEKECSAELERIKANMVKAFDYSEESRGRRRSKRLAAKRDQERMTPQMTPQMKRLKGQPDLPPPSPPPPPPPPPPVSSSDPSSALTPLVTTTLRRRPLSVKQPEGKTVSKTKPKIAAPVGCNPFHEVLHEINGPTKKMTLRSTVPRSPGGTPVAGWPKNIKCDANLGYFNSKLADKFKNIRSPVFNSLAAPGTFESPVSPSPEPSINTTPAGF